MIESHSFVVSAVVAFGVPPPVTQLATVYASSLTLGARISGYACPVLEPVVAVLEWGTIVASLVVVAFGQHRPISCNNIVVMVH